MHRGGVARRSFRVEMRVRRGGAVKAERLDGAGGLPGRIQRFECKLLITRGRDGKCSEIQFHNIRPVSGGRGFVGSSGNRQTQFRFHRRR